MPKSIKEEILVLKLWGKAGSLLPWHSWLWQA